MALEKLLPIKNIYASGIIHQSFKSPITDYNIYCITTSLGVFGQLTMSPIY